MSSSNDKPEEPGEVIFQFPENKPDYIKLAKMIEIVYNQVHISEIGNWPPSHFSNYPKHLQLAGDRMGSMGIEPASIHRILGNMSLKKCRPYPKDLHRRGRVKKPWE